MTKTLPPAISGYDTAEAKVLCHPESSGNFGVAAFAIPECAASIWNATASLIGVAVAPEGEAGSSAPPPQPDRKATSARLAVQRRATSAETFVGQAMRYMFLRYCPPTSNSASVICPSEHTRTASTSTSNTLPLAITVS